MENLRAGLKHNFLKQVIVRIDFNGIFDADVEECVRNIRKFLYDNQFTITNERIENQVDLQVRAELGIIDESSFVVSNNQKNKIYVFSTEEKEVIEISKQFLTLTIDAGSLYKTFDYYIPIIGIVFQNLKKTSEYFKVLRLGLRKINICFFRTFEDISQYFDQAVFNTKTMKSQFSDYEYKASNYVSVYEVDGYKVNYVRNLQQGIMEENGQPGESYQVALDLDIYEDDIFKLHSKLDNEERQQKTLAEMNDYIFDFFRRSLKPDFIEELKMDIFADTKIEGVI